MKYEDIKRVNEELNKIDVKGKDYVEVNQRIKAFRQLNPNGSIITEILSIDNGVVIIKATIENEIGRIIATGIAYEKENSTCINRTSYIENCETSAVGRALGMCGFGIDTSVASAEEVKNAINNQNTQDLKLLTQVQTLIVKTDADKEAINKFYKVDDISKLTNAQLIQIKTKLEKN